VRFQWEPVFSGPVFSGSQSSVGASFQWERVFSGCVFSGCQSSVGASLQRVLFKMQEKDYKLNIIVYSINQDIKRCFNVF
jgi:hypothetical protein